MKIRALKLFHSVFLLGLAALISGCGWTLRGANIDETLAVSQLEYATQTSSSLSRILNRSFAENSAADQRYRLIILSEFQSEQTQSLTAALRNSQLRMEKRVEYQISDIEGELVEVGTALVWRDLDQDEFTPGSTEREKAFLQEEIDEEIVQQLLRHLERFAINHATQS